jgi:fatty-acyl-CoA synthase
MSELELRKFCQGNISHFKIPRFTKFVDKFPVNANNKVLKNKMREIAIEELTEIKIKK